MAKTSSIEKNKRRARMAKRFAGRRDRLKKIARDRNLSMEERFAATPIHSRRNRRTKSAAAGSNALCVYAQPIVKTRLILFH